MYYPSRSEYQILKEKGDIVPVSREIFSDMETPIGLFRRFANEKNSFLLESVEGGEKWSRYSFIGRNPFLILENINGVSLLHDKNKIHYEEGTPLEVLRKYLARYKAVKIPDLPRFCGGVVGYFSYDFVRYFEKLPSAPEVEYPMADCYLMFFNEIIAYDHLKQRVLIIVNAHRDVDGADGYEEAISRIDAIYESLMNTSMERMHGEAAVNGQRLEPCFHSNFSQRDFCLAVKRAKEYIVNGDIFQVVLSQRFSIETAVHPFNVYRVLRVLNPSPYMFYLNLSGAAIVGASPEMLVRVENGRIETCPIAGTRRRGKTEEEDKMLEKELLCDEKERAEHTMLVDLGRNDVGKVSRFGTVKVDNGMHIEKFSHVMHIVSNIAGEMREDKDGLDALAALLPAGTLSGAPKIRAMEIINELEPDKRGLYGGCIGYIGFDGNLDTCITIRTILFKEGKAYVQAGAGIVADSEPEKEYEESMNKARALMNALDKAGDIHDCFDR